jgi:hypothetical protein
MLKQFSALLVTQSPRQGPPKRPRIRANRVSQGPAAELQGDTNAGLCWPQSAGSRSAEPVRRGSRQTPSVVDPEATADIRVDVEFGTHA